ncbi:MAG: dihydroneopterin aldolase [Bacteroidetes bacterium]|nr:dihydroneopterin aldolase [Bacteroidota bacterium]
MNLLKVGLQGLEIYAYHGVFEAERRLGNRYTVDIAATLETAGPPPSLEDTLDYGKLGEIVQAHMAVPVALLETLCWGIARQVLATSAQVGQVQVRITKHNPPVGQLCAHSFAELTLNRDDA